MGDGDGEEGINKWGMGEGRSKCQGEGCLVIFLVSTNNRCHVFAYFLVELIFLKISMCLFWKDV